MPKTKAKAKKFKVYAAWGRDGDYKTTHTFNTQAEKDAFIEGAEAADGWQYMAFFDSIKDRNDYIKHECY